MGFNSGFKGLKLSLSKTESCFKQNNHYVPEIVAFIFAQILLHSDRLAAVSNSINIVNKLRKLCVEGYSLNKKFLYKFTVSGVWCRCKCWMGMCVNIYI